MQAYHRWATSSVSQKAQTRNELDDLVVQSLKEGITPFQYRRALDAHYAKLWKEGFFKRNLI